MAPRRGVSWFAAALLLAILATGAWAWALSTYARHPDTPTLFERAQRALATAEPGPSPVILVVGDSGSGSPQWRANLAAMAREENVLLAVHAGDVTYRRVEEYRRFVAAVEALPFPLIAVPGDHDGDLDPDLAVFEALIGGRNGILDVGDLRFLLLDTSSGTLSPEAEAALDREVAATMAERAAAAASPDAPRPKRRIVVSHSAPYQANLKFPGSLGKFHAIHDPPEAQRMLDRLRAMDVALLASGHWHAFAHDTRAGFDLLASGGGGKDVEPGHDFHYVRVTLSDPPVIEQKVTSPGESGGSVANWPDALLTGWLAFGGMATLVFWAVTAVAMWLCWRDDSVREGNVTGA